MLVHGDWAIKKGGVPASFGRYGSQRHHFETAHSIRVAPTGIEMILVGRLIR